MRSERRVVGRADDLIVDPDVDLHDPEQRADVGRRELQVLAAVSAGGVIGAEARYGITELMPSHSGTWPWATLLINVAGSLLIGVLMVVLLDLVRAHHLARPLLGTGVLGGFTTYSTFALEVHRMLAVHRPVLALGYVAASIAGCLAAVTAGVVLTRALATRERV